MLIESLAILATPPACALVLALALALPQQLLGYRSAYSRLLLELEHIRVGL